ncbi:MAG: hypothetical protein CME70_06870 [Halobacteriovorax sp.]|nr:hypothetical protein [Halobacteriovorax sp.]|tara:strand:+ start:471892 stop:473427 length:1536 start_codon:yes stop_codon:yes gene_type:complete
MEKYKLAKKLYSQNKFETAVEYFKDSFNTEVLNENEKIDCLTQIIRIQKIINKTDDDIKVEKDLAEFLINRKEYSTASEVLLKLTKKIRNYEISFRLVETLKLEGRLDKAEEESLELFKYLYKKKNYEKTISFYKFAQDNFPPNIKFDSFFLIATIMRGDIDGLEKIQSFDSEILFETLVSSPFNHWRHSKRFFDIVMENAMSSQNYLLNKLGIKLLLEIILMGQEWITEENLSKLIVFFTKSGRKTISRHLCNFAISKEINLEEAVTNKIDSLPEDEEVDTDLDFGQDLFSEDGGKDQVSKLVDDIELLQSMGELEEADLLLSKLKRIDPSNHMLRKDEDGTKLRVKRMNVEDLEKVWSESFQEEIDSNYKISIRARATLNTLTDEELKNSYADLIVCFNTMELFEVSLEVFKRLNEIFTSRTMEEELEINYLLVKTFVGNKDFFKAYDLVTQINGSTPITGEKRIEFLYLQGEIARKLGRKKDAVKSYLLVKEINPNYRLVRQRLMSFG